MYAEKPKRKNDDERIFVDSYGLWRFLLILLVIGVTVIIMLAMLSPAIGNIFSNATSCFCLRSSMLVT